MIRLKLGVVCEYEEGWGGGVDISLGRQLTY